LIWSDFFWRSPKPAGGSSAGPVTQVRQLELKTRRFMDNLALGARASRFRGHGIEFSEVRQYQPGDPFQAIDWKVTARMRRPFVKRFVEEREMGVLLVVDASASQRFGTERRLKSDLAAEVASVLALSAVRSREPVGLLLFSDRIERFVRPARGRQRNLQLLYDLVSLQPEGRGTDLALALNSATRLLKIRSLVFLISDFRGAGAFERPLFSLSARHDVVAIDVGDEAEYSPPPAGWVELADPETGRRAVVNLADPRWSAALAEQGRHRDTALRRLCGRCGVDYVRLGTGQSFEADLAACIGARKERLPG